MLVSHSFLLPGGSSVLAEFYQKVTTLLNRFDPVSLILQGKQNKLLNHSIKVASREATWNIQNHV